MIKSEILSMDGSNGLCLVLSIAFSKIKIIEGNTVTQQITPITTPLIITIPRSRPSSKVMKINAAKPATVVTELPATEINVLAMASAIASLRFS